MPHADRSVSARGPGARAALPGRGTDRHRSLGRQLLRFAAVGTFSTVATLALFAALVAVGAHRQVANLAALLAGTVLNTAANRRWTFGVRGAGGALRHQGQGMALFALHWLLTAGALLALEQVAPGAGTAAATATVGAATVLATVVKFLAFRVWMRPA